MSLAASLTARPGTRGKALAPGSEPKAGQGMKVEGDEQRASRAILASLTARALRFQEAEKRAREDLHTLCAAAMVVGDPPPLASTAEKRLLPPPPQSSTRRIASPVQYYAQWRPQPPEPPPPPARWL